MLLKSIAFYFQISQYDAVMHANEMEIFIMDAFPIENGPKLAPVMTKIERLVF